jgi:hypothetical protein
MATVARRLPKDKINYFLVPTKEGATVFIRASFYNELTHLRFGLFLLVYSLLGISVLNSLPLWILFSGLSSILCWSHFVLVLIQRYNRIRVLRFLARHNDPP